MTAEETLALLERATLLLDEQRLRLAGEGDLDAIEALGDEVGSLLARLGATDLAATAQAPRLHAAARHAHAALVEAQAALLARRARLNADQARAERESSALKSYQPPSPIGEARFLDERR